MVVSASDLWSLSCEQLCEESDFRLAVPQFPCFGLLLVVVVSTKAMIFAACGALSWGHCQESID